MGPETGEILVQLKLDQERRSFTNALNMFVGSFTIVLQILAKNCKYGQPRDEVIY